MLRALNITNVIDYILACFNSYVWTPWEWHRRAQTCRGS